MELNSYKNFSDLPKFNDYISGMNQVKSRERRRNYRKLQDRELIPQVPMMKRKD